MSRETTQSKPFPFIYENPINICKVGMPENWRFSGNITQPFKSNFITKQIANKS
jgi:hypothetical protein